MDWWRCYFESCIILGIALHCMLGNGVAFGRGMETVE